MAFKFTNEDGSNISMEQATRMLENSLDKSDVGEQIINGVIKIEDEGGSPVELKHKNQVITKKHIDDRFDAYVTVNINIPFNIDLDSEISICYTKHNYYVYRCKCNERTAINGIQVPKGNIYTIWYESTKTTTFVEYTLDLSNADHSISVYNIDLIPVAKLNMLEGGYKGGLYNKYCYAIFINSCDNILLPNTNVEMFILGSGQNGRGNKSPTNTTSMYYGYGGKRTTVTIPGDNNIASIAIGANSDWNISWVDSYVNIGENTYSSSLSGECSNLSDGVLPFNEPAFVNLYGASGNHEGLSYKTGGGSSGEVNGKFFGAGGGSRGVNAGGWGSNGIVIMRWRVE